MTNAREVLDAQVEGCDAARRRLVPPLDRFHGAAVCVSKDHRFAVIVAL